MALQAELRFTPSNLVVMGSWSWHESHWIETAQATPVAVQVNQHGYRHPAKPWYHWVDSVSNIGSSPVPSSSAEIFDTTSVTPVYPTSAAVWSANIGGSSPLTNIGASSSHHNIGHILDIARPLLHPTGLRFVRAAAPSNLKTTA